MRWLLLFGIILIGCSCNNPGYNNTDEVKTTIRQWHDKEIILPSSLKCIENDSLTSFKRLVDNKGMTIITLISGDCEKCIGALDYGSDPILFLLKLRD